MLGCKRQHVCKRNAHDDMIWNAWHASNDKATTANNWKTPGTSVSERYTLCANMLLRWLWCGMMGWYPPLNDLSDLTWHMFTQVVETNQHSLHDIDVHGGLYPTHALHPMFITFNACTWLLSLSSWLLPSLLLAFTCTKRAYCLCIQSLKPQSYCRWVHYTFLYAVSTCRPK